MSESQSQSSAPVTRSEFVNTVDQDQYMWDVKKGAMKGLAAGIATFGLGNALLVRRNPALRGKYVVQKFFVGMMYSVGVGAFFAEKAGERYIEETQIQRGGTYQTVIAVKQAQAENRWQAMTNTERLKDWGMRNQYKIIGASWIASLGIAFGIVARDRYQTLPQKIVQARMWAQGLTVGVLIVSGVLAGVNARSGKKAEPLPVDHSWQDMLENSGTLSAEDKVILHNASKKVSEAAAAATAA